MNKLINDRRVTLTVGTSRKAVNWKPVNLYLSELWQRLRAPERGTETLAAYLALPKGRQDELKDVGGYVAGQLSGPRRRAGAVTGRDIITLDLDNIPAGGTQDVLRRVAGLGCGYCVYSTRKHMPSAPRLRVLLPLSRTCTADEYEPIARYLAGLIGPELADPTTFEPGRMMYWPSCCADGEYIFQAEDKPLPDVDGLLALCGDWNDLRALPAPEGPGVRQEDPESKKGLVGAFCRVYDIEAAMETFLPGVYEPVPGSPGRYTYTKGSSTGGAVLYEGGRFLYSHHATDPCGRRLVNAFDLVRLHLYGDRDDAAAEGTPAVKLPSYTAMAALARNDEPVRRLLLDERAAAAFGRPEEEEEEEDTSWRQLLTLNSQGAPQKTMQNLRALLEHEPHISGRLRLNLFTGRIDVTGELPWPRPGSPENWNDDDRAQLRLWLEPFFGKVTKQDIEDTVQAVAGDQAYHPVRDYLNGLIWDGLPRLDTLLVDYLGAADTAYTRAVTRKAFTAAAARVMRPGCKYDTMLVLVGRQGRHKSTLLAKMGGAWFSDSLRSFGDKDAMETIQGTWINEIAELQAMNKADVDAVKMFLTKTSDYYRAAYGRYTADRPRQCVFFGTTNTKECLTDATGSRRFWPVDIDQRERTKDVFRDLAGERDQLWAEAMTRLHTGEPLHLGQELEDIAVQIQEEHRARHPWEGLIAAFLEEELPVVGWYSWDLQKRMTWRTGGMRYEGPTRPRARVCAAEIWCEALGRQRGDMKKRDAREINSILDQMPGWAYAGLLKTGEIYGPQRCYQRGAKAETTDV